MVWKRIPDFNSAKPKLHVIDPFPFIVRTPYKKPNRSSIPVGRIKFPYSDILPIMKMEERV